MATIERYATKSGATLWRVRYRTPDKRSTQKRGFTTKRDAERFANKVEVAKMAGEYVAPALGKATVGDLGPAWLQRQRGHLKASTLQSYELSWATLRGAGAVSRFRTFITPRYRHGWPSCRRGAARGR